ncbi:tyrosine kinase receptor Cad96Ca-like [Ptychodera flava]|uniref:tyrosine kinase receptor Cad96Ca-like n=1 Tax=Ptychodera flava TaxID=63121 RepID=UPI00396A10E3
MNADIVLQGNGTTIDYNTLQDDLQTCEPRWLVAQTKFDSIGFADAGNYTCRSTQLAGSITMEKYLLVNVEPHPEQGDYKIYLKIVIPIAAIVVLSIIIIILIRRRKLKILKQEDFPSDSESLTSTTGNNCSGTKEDSPMKSHRRTRATSDSEKPLINDGKGSDDASLQPSQGCSSVTKVSEPRGSIIKFDAENEQIDLSSSSSNEEVTPFISPMTQGYQKAWELSHDDLDFSPGTILGKGEFGLVLKAKLCDTNKNNSTEVAVKCLKDNASAEDRRDLLRELAIMLSLNASHPNVVKLLGCCTKRDPIYIVVELVQNGSLQDYLLGNRSPGLYQNLHPNSRNMTAVDLLQFAWQIARGMSFISSKQCIHRDLATRNILLDENKCCKISDFGLARDVSGFCVYERMSQGRLPLRWMALESLISSIYTTKSDVWSYGIVLWEIVTLGSTPYAALSSNQVINMLRGGKRMPKPRHCSEEIYRIMRQCWYDQAHARPTFSELCVKVEKLINKTSTVHLKLDDFESHLYVNIPVEEWPHGEKM